MSLTGCWWLRGLRVPPCPPRGAAPPGGPRLFVRSPAPSGGASGPAGGWGSRWPRGWVSRVGGLREGVPERRGVLRGDQHPSKWGRAAPRTEETEAGAGSQRPTRDSPHGCGRGVSPEDGRGGWESRLPLPPRTCLGGGSSPGAAIRDPRVPPPPRPAGCPRRRCYGCRCYRRGVTAAGVVPGAAVPGAYLPLQLHWSAAPLFMLDLYHAVAGEEEEEGEEAAVSRPVLTGLSTQSPPPGSVVSRADTVVSLVNMGEKRSGGTGRIGGRRGHRGCRGGPGDPGCAGHRGYRRAPGSTGGTGTCGQDPGGFGSTGGIGMIGAHRGSPRVPGGDTGECGQDPRGFGSTPERTGATGACGGTGAHGDDPGGLGRTGRDRGERRDRGDQSREEWTGRTGREAAAEPRTARSRGGTEGTPGRGAGG